MLQRIQTIYLFISGIITLLLLYFPYITIISENNNEFSIQTTSWGIDLISDSSTIFVLNLTTITVSLIIIISGLLSFFIISIYKKRQLQIKLGKINLILLTALLVLMMFFIDNAMQILMCNNNCNRSISSGVIFPVTAIICTFLANRSIKKDEIMVKDSDRIR